MTIKTSEMPRAATMATILKNCDGNPYWVDLVNQWALCAGIIGDDQLVTDASTFIEYCFQYGFSADNRTYYGDMPLALLQAILSELESVFGEVSLSAIVETYVNYMTDNGHWVD